MTSLLFLGFLIGMRHALEADHVAAVATLATETRSLKSAIKQGAIWGSGHTLALFAFGSAAILSDSVIPETLAHWLEFAVGVMLVLLGLSVIRRMIRERVHFHLHRHGDDTLHFHAHKHSNVAHHDPMAHQHSHNPLHAGKALFVGLMHGMAGSAALILLTLQTVDSTATALLYMLLFGIGSIVGMAALSIVIAIPLRQSARGLTWLNNGLHLVIGLATVALGALLIMETGGGLI